MILAHYNSYLGPNPINLASSHSDLGIILSSSLSLSPHTSNILCKAYTCSHEKSSIPHSHQKLLSLLPMDKETTPCLRLKRRAVATSSEVVRMDKSNYGIDCAAADSCSFHYLFIFQSLQNHESKW